MPKVSVIVPTLNRTSLISRALDSIVAQTFQDYEVIVVQNGPKNETEAIVLEYAKRGMPVRFIYEPVANAARARNIGVKAAKGEWIAFLEDDDIWYPEKLSKQVEALVNPEVLGLVTCRSKEVNEAGEFRRYRPENPKPCNFKMLTSVPSVEIISSLSGILVSKKAFDRVGYFDESFRISGDVKFYIDLSRYFSCVSLDDILFDYTVHGRNLSGNRELGWWEMIRILKTVRPLPAQGVSNAGIREFLGYYSLKFYALGADLVAEKKYRGACEAFLKALWAEPRIGTQVPWSSSQKLFLNYLKPYAAILYCGIKSIVGGFR